MIIYLLIPLYYKISEMKYDVKIEKNIKLIFSQILSNKNLLFKFLFYLFQAILCFYYITNLSPKIQICSSLFNDYRSLDEFSFPTKNKTSEISSTGNIIL